MSSAPEAPGLFDEPLKSEFVTERLTTDLKQQIESGKLSSGSLVRPVRELMKQYRISYNSVRKALNQLADDGYLALEQGRGTFVRGAKVPRGPRSELIDKKEDIESREKVSLVVDKEEKVVEGKDEPPAPVSAPVSRDRKAAPVSRTKTESVVNQSVPEMPHAKVRGTRIAVGVAERVLNGACWGMEQALQAFQQEALKARWSLEVVSIGKEAELPDGRFSVVWGMVDPVCLAAWVKPGRACVVVGYWPPKLEVSAVVADNFAGGYELTRQMVLRGHREVAFLHGGPRIPGGGAAERLAGCRVALEEAGLSLPDALALECPVDADWLADRVLALKPRPSAVLVSEQLLAEGLMRQLKERGVGVPRALSVACFGPKDGANPLNITSARVNWSRAGSAVVDRLRELLSGAPNERLRINLPVEFHAGSTVDRP